MRSPRGPGVSRSGATVIATVLGLTALAATPVIGGHHLESENEAAAPKPTKVMVIAPDKFTDLVGARRTFWATICNEDGSGCKDAKKAKWSVKPKNGLKLSKKKGMQIAVDGKRAGLYELTAKQNGISTTITVKINEPREPEPAEPVAELRLYITPEELTLAPGELAILSAWGCPLGANGRLGENGVADGVDDDCLPQYIEEVRLDEGSGATLLGPMGSLFGIRMDELDGTDTAATRYGLVSAVLRTAQDIEPASAGPRFIGAQVVTGIGATLPSIMGDPAKSNVPDDAVDIAFQDVLKQLKDGYADGATAGVLANLLFGEGGEPASGDIDGDGLVDQRDLFVTEAILDINTDGPGQDDPIHNPAVDMDGDGSITAADVRVIRGLWQRSVQEGLQAAAGS